MHGDFHTVGDIAYRDEEGYYYICDRKNDMIISGGMNIYPAEIEAALEQHPGIFDVAVFGIPSEQWGEQVHAAVVPAPGSVAVGGGRDRLRPRAPGRLQVPPLGVLRWTNSRARARASCSSASSGHRTGPVMPGRSANPSAPRVRMPESRIPRRSRPLSAFGDQVSYCRAQGAEAPGRGLRAAASVCAVAGSTTSR